MEDAEMLEIWGRPYSSNVIPVIWTAEELQLPYKLKLAGGRFGKLDSQDYAAINPNRMIPAFRDGDFHLWESHTIVRYLCASYGMDIPVPARHPAARRSRSMDEWSGTTAFTPVIQLFFLPRFVPSRTSVIRILSHAWANKPRRCWTIIT